MKRLFFALILTTVGCQLQEQDLLRYVNGRQLLNLNGLNRNGTTIIDPTVQIIASDSIRAGDTFLAKVFLDDKHYQLIDAYFDCVEVRQPTVDTAFNASNNRKKLDGCTKGLYVENDTIYISFVPSAPGKHTFIEITILTRDTEKIFRTLKYKFHYVVVEAEKQ